MHDFGWLNGAAGRRIDTMPKIEDLLFGIHECECLTKTDISMQCYAFWLDEESSWCCVFSAPFGKHELNRLASDVCSLVTLLKQLWKKCFVIYCMSSKCAWMTSCSIM